MSCLHKATSNGVWVNHPLLAVTVHLFLKNDKANHDGMPACPCKDSHLLLQRTLTALKPANGPVCLS